VENGFPIPHLDWLGHAGNPHARDRSSHHGVREPMATCHAMAALDSLLPHLRRMLAVEPADPFTLPSPAARGDDR